MKTYKIHLIRHGLTEANEQGKYIGRTDLALTDDSVKELKKIRKSYTYPDASVIYSGPLQRCVQTAQILYPDREIQTVDNLTEYDFGDFEGKTGEELDGRPDFTAWVSGKMPAPPNGESNEDFQKRVVLGFNQIVVDLMRKGETSGAVIVHAGVMTTLLASCALPQRRAVEWGCDAGFGYTLLVTPTVYQRSGVVEVIDLIPYPNKD